MGWPGMEPPKITLLLQENAYQTPKFKKLRTRAQCACIIVLKHWIGRKENSPYFIQSEKDDITPSG